ncbi:MAG: DUF3109 family protein [Tidjanibacter sp.]|nr:DUF3109 family protein [Tidjanibacter sp.]MBR3853320.1 DUF3109 family protein [Tidjanibacter sp.]
MIEIDGKIIATDLLTEEFCCDLSVCKGECCVEGDSGAPLDIEEVDLLEQEWENYKPYMTPEGVEEIERQGFMVVDVDGDYTTPLVDGAQCAYAFKENGITFCAIERAYREGKTTFLKPISCHLYPIRVKRFSTGDYGLNLHRWNICKCAFECGKKNGVKLYRALREPIVRAFGEDFYEQLCQAALYVENEE